MRDATWRRKYQEQLMEQIAGQNAAIAEANQLGRPVDFRGLRFYPAGEDGIPIVGTIPQEHSA